MARILIVDDDASCRSTLREAVERLGHDADEAIDGKKAVSAVCCSHFHAVILSLDLPKRSGIRALKSITFEYPDVPVLAIASPENKETAVEGLKVGAKYYMLKPVNPDELRILIERTLQSRIIEQNSLISDLRRRSGFESLIGTNPKLEAAIDLAIQAAQTDALVLLVGERGTGKEHLARAIHHHGNRASGAFVKIGSGAAASGRSAAHSIREISQRDMERAHGGTLYLNELRALGSAAAEQLAQMTAGKRKKPVRVIAATRETPESPLDGDPMDQLLSDAATVVIDLPPLRERIEDIPMLVEHFLEIYSGEAGRGVCAIADDAMGCLIDREWKGNIRELANCIEHSIIQCDGGCVQTVHLGSNGWGHSPSLRKKMPVKSLREVERDHIKRALVHCNWNRSGAASLLEIDRKTLRNKIREFGFKPPPGK